MWRLHTTFNRPNDCGLPTVKCAGRAPGRLPRQNFGGPYGKIVKYAGLNSDQLDLIPGKNLARLLRIELKPSARKTMDITQI